MRNSIAAVVLVCGLGLVGCAGDPGGSDGDGVSTAPGQGSAAAADIQQQCPRVCEILCNPVKKGFEKFCASAICDPCNFGTPDAPPATPDAPPATPDARPPTPDAPPATPDARPVTPDAPPAPPDARPVTPDAPPATPDAPPAVDLTGTFISHVTTTGSITVPLIGTKTANIDIVLRIFNSATNGSGALNSHLEFCRVNASATDGSLVANFPTTVTALLVADQPSSQAGVRIGGPVTLPNFSITVGQDANGNQVDSDHDGNPGVSLPTTLSGSNETAFSGLTITLAFPSATLTDANDISGQSSFTTNGTVFGGAPLNITGAISVTPSAASVSFTSQKLAGNVPCSQVLTRF